MNSMAEAQARERAWMKTPVGEAYHRMVNAVAHAWQVDGNEHASGRTLKSAWFYADVAEKAFRRRLAELEARPAPPDRPWERRSLMFYGRPLLEPLGDGHYRETDMAHYKRALGQYWLYLMDRDRWQEAEAVRRRILDGVGMGSLVDYHAELEGFRMDAELIVQRAHRCLDAALEGIDYRHAYAWVTQCGPSSIMRAWRGVDYGAGDETVQSLWDNDVKAILPGPLKPIDEPTHYSGLFETVYAGTTALEIVKGSPFKLKSPFTTGELIPELTKTERDRLERVEAKLKPPVLEPELPVYGRSPAMIDLLDIRALQERTAQCLASPDHKPRRQTLRERVTEWWEALRWRVGVAIMGGDDR